MSSIQSTQLLKIAAEENYYELIEYLGSDWNIATALSDIMNLRKETIYSYLSRFAFKKQNLLSSFITASQFVIRRIEQIEIDCRVLYIDQNMEIETVLSRAKKLNDEGMYIICPQLILCDFEKREKFKIEGNLEFLAKDIEYVDFIVKASLGMKEAAMLDSINLEKKEIVDYCEMKKIKTLAKRISINKRGGAKWIGNKNMI